MVDLVTRDSKKKFISPLHFPLPQQHDLSGLPFDLFATVCQKKVNWPTMLKKIVNFKACFGKI
jgi:hypothetical protein